jgi:hypothetical protein
MSAVQCLLPAHEQRQPAQKPASQFYQVHRHADRWAVTHALPGMHGSWAVDVCCPTQAAAEREAARMNMERSA